MRRPAALPRPLAGLLMDEQRDAAGQFVYPVDVVGRPGLGGVQLADVPDGIAGQWAERELRCLAAGRSGGVVGCDRVAAEGRDHEHGRGPAPAGEIGNDFEGLGIGQMQVVEDDEHRAALRPRRQVPCHRLGDVPGVTRTAVDVSEGRARALQGLAEQGAGPAVGVVTAPVEHRRAVVVDVASQLRDQSRLADALRPQHRHEAAPPVDRVRPRLPQPRHLGLAAEECGTHRGERRRKPARDRGRRHRAKHVQRRVLCQDGRLQSAQVGSGLDAELVGQQSAGPLVGLEGVALTPRPVQSEHQLTPQPFTERLLAQQCLDLAHQLGRLASGQIRVHPVLHQPQTQLLQATALGDARLDLAELPKRLTPPQAQRLSQRRGRRVVAADQLVRSPLGQLPEPCGVELGGIEPQLVAAANRYQHRARLASGRRGSSVRRSRAT